MNFILDKSLAPKIKQKASDLGFDLCGIAPSRPLREREIVLRNWCAAGMNSGMGYLGRNIEKRINPELLFTGARSVIVTGLNYFTNDKQEQQDVPVISRYAYGTKYQDVIKKKLDKVLDFIRKSEPGAEGQTFVDSEPLLEKAWAVEAGLGWQGRHSIVINDNIGSFFFIGIIVVNIELEHDKPYGGNRCGNCRICIEKCPTGAINEDNTIDARKCIANLTIENRGPIPEDIVPEMGYRVYGCDRCQEVCPWNKHAEPNNTPEFQLSDELRTMTREEWINLSAERFERLFSKSPVERRKYEPFMSNINVVTKSKA
jgi:epoxyqueuosine reductase